jgi:glycerophosphoryl diester phosphodiesterase
MTELPRSFTARPIAHRALHDEGAGVIENSPTAIHRAMRAGYGIELDLQLSADGVAMVFHDDTLDRLTAVTGPVRGRSARDLGDLRLAGGEDCIPTLSDVLEMVDGAVPLLLELKDQSGGLGQAEADLERAVAMELEGYGGDVAVMSFNPHVIAQMRDLAPQLPRGLVTCGYIPSQWPHLSPETCTALRSIASFGQVGAGFISHDWTDLGSPRVAELKAQGVPVLCWTIRNAHDEREARRIADTVTFEGYLPPLDPPRD